MRRRPLRQARRLGVIVIGFSVLIIGLVLAALPMIPGGMLGILLGLTILSAELEWARRLRTRIPATGRRFLPRPFKRRRQEQSSLGDPLLAEEAGPSRHGVRGLPIVVIGLAVAAVLLAVTLITQTDVATAP